MYLKALEIQGFKSFPDKTKISFDKGITAVVGPNGSGKSNISDALRWVLGETSVKQLRGGGKMENVIFGGTTSRNPMGYASVQLILDNTDRRLEVDADEVTIGRRYYRSGESEYSINGQSVRLRDVYELLLDTGLGRDGYSIIGQGRIAEIVGAKSAERREIFEEASGIARFRYRKNEAQRRLAATEENLTRLRDILGELEGRVGPLEKECEKAQKFLDLSQQKKSLEVTLWVDTLRTSREALRGHQRKMETAEADYAAKGAEIDRIDAESQSISTEIEQIIIEVDRANATIRGLQEEVAGRDSNIAVLKNNIEHNLASIASIEDEIAASGDTETDIADEIQRHTDEIQKVRDRVTETEGQIAALEQQLADIQQKSLASGEKRGQLQAALAGLTDEATALKVSEAAAVSAAEASEARLSELTPQLEQAEDNLTHFSQQQSDTEEFLEEIGQTITKLENIKNGLEMKLNARRSALEKARGQELEIAGQAEAAHQRINMLRELENSLDGFQNSVKTVIKAARDGRLRGVIGPVSTILSVQPGYEIAIETALGYSLQNVVVDGETAAKAAMAHLKKTNTGRATFLPLDTVKPRHFDPSRLPAGALSAKALVRYDPKYENIVSSLLARIVVVEDINEASSAARALDYRNRVVTRDGQVINAGGSFTGGSTSRSAGLFSRKQELQDLAAKLEQLQEKKRQAVEETGKIKAEVDALDAELTATASEAITASEDKIRAEGELKSAAAALETAAARKKQLEEEQQSLQTQLEKARQDRAAAEQGHTRVAGEISALSAQLAQLSGEDDGFLTQREGISARLTDLRLAALDLKRDAEAHRQSIETLNSRTGESKARREMLLANIETHKAQNAQHTQQIQSVEREAVDSKDKITEIEQKIESLTQQRLQMEGLRNGLKEQERAFTNQREDLGREAARLAEQKSGLESQYEATINQLWEEYELTPAAAEPLCVEFESPADLRRQVGELRGRIRALGNVNVGAIEEFAEVNERYVFLKAQVADVEASKRELEKMIEELCAEMTHMFSESFAEINRHFGRIFAELFGGGSGSLSLSDPDDLLESGIDIQVAPPGKIIKDLSALSGGEQALVAICIYFAILAVNPSPFCVLDEIEAALDDSNVTRYAHYLRRITARTQFIVITHRRGTMEEADVLYGVTMQEDGVSKMLKLNIADVDVSLVQ